MHNLNKVNNFSSVTYRSGILIAIKIHHHSQVISLSLTAGFMDTVSQVIIKVFKSLSFFEPIYVIHMMVWNQLKDYNI